MEFLILSALQFDLTFPTALRFLERFMRMIGDDKDVITFSQFLMELSLIDVRMLQYPSSIIATSALTLAYKTITRRIHPQTISAECEKRVDAFVRESLGFGKEHADMLLLCSKELHFLQLRSMNSSLQAVRKKYQSSEYTSVHPYIFSHWQIWQQKETGEGKVIQSMAAYRAACMRGSVASHRTSVSLLSFI